MIPTGSAAMMRSYSTTNSSNRNSNNNNLPPRVLARVAREIRDLMKNPPEGLRIVLDSDTGLPTSLGDILAEIEGPEGTPYASRYFQIKLIIPADFPHSPCRGFFLTKIYHPNVDVSSGAICVNTLKKDWTPNVSLSHVFNVIRCLLIVPFPESSLNDEAGKLFMESYSEYARRAKLMANVHGHPYPYDNCVTSPESPAKNSKENENGNLNFPKNHSKVCLTSSTNTVLKQSNAADQKKNVYGSKVKDSGKNNFVKSGTEKKSKKKSLRRL